MKTTIGLISLLSLACGTADVGADLVTTGEKAEALTLSAQVHFSGCTEFVGIDTVPIANALAALPAGYEPRDFGNITPIVVRAVECEAISVDGHAPKPGRLSQIGLSIPPGADDIHNYTLAYVTNHAKLHAKLRAMGANSIKDNSLTYAFTPSSGGVGTISVGSEKGLDYDASGNVTEPPDEEGDNFVAVWWEDGRHGTLRARTELPDIVFNFEGDVTLTAPAGDELAELVGSTSLSFPFLNSYNRFDNATMYLELQ